MKDSKLVIFGMTKENMELKEEVKNKLVEKSKAKLKKEPIVEEKINHIDLKNQHKTIHSHELLQQGKEVFILHRGDQYLLRCTRNGKLILTK